MASSNILRIAGAAIAALFISCAFMADASASPARGGSASECTRPDGKGIQRCRAGLPRKRMQELLRMQEDTQWCWAAGIAMLFAAVGLEVDQGHVVRTNFGELLNWPARAGEITRLLNRRWLDRAGRAFVASAHTSGAGMDINRDAPHLLEEMKAGRPVMLAAMSHIVVLAELEFERSTRDGEVRIVGGTVLDPAEGKGIRPMADYELKPAYVARVRVQPADGEQAAVTHYRELVLR